MLSKATSSAKGKTALIVVFLAGLFFFPKTSVQAQPDTTALAGKIMVGYWQNFDNGAGFIQLRDVSEDFDVINVSFAVPVHDSSAQMQFVPDNATTVMDFKAGVKELQDRGKKVLISVGGATGNVHLNNEEDAVTFGRSMIEIIERYGFDGVDIDLEGSWLSLEPGDTDFRNPTSPLVVNLIAAVAAIADHFGPTFILTAAPETAYVQGGFSSYGGVWGAYLPFIHAMRDRLTYLHVQHYNTGTMTALDGQLYTPATADFHVAMAEMLLQGFPVVGDPQNVFPPLRPEQVAIGFPASPLAADHGFTAPEHVHQALDYLIKGESFGGDYVLRKEEGYPAFRGLMTWSINWDAFNGFEFSTAHREYLDGLTGRTGTWLDELSLPGGVRLEQNYPNPFGTTTRLRYALDQSAFVTLSIYNTVGREEVTLVQARRPAGWHELILDGSSLSGGGYYYRLRVGSLSMARKMVVMRP